MNTTFPTGISNLDVSENADFVQYRIQFIVTDQDNWDEPDLDSIQIRSEHAAFVPFPIYYTLEQKPCTFKLVMMFLEQD